MKDASKINFEHDTTKYHKLIRHTTDTTCGLYVETSKSIGLGKPSSFASFRVRVDRELEDHMDHYKLSEAMFTFNWLVIPRHLAKTIHPNPNH